MSSFLGSGFAGYLILTKCGLFFNLLCVFVLHCFSRVQLCVTLWIVACQTPLSMGFSRQEYWSELPHPPPGDLLDPGIEPASVVSPALAGGFFTTRNTFQIYPWLSLFCLYCFNNVLSSNDFQFVSLIHSAVCNDS